MKTLSRLMAEAGADGAAGAGAGGGSAGDGSAAAGAGAATGTALGAGAAAAAGGDAPKPLPERIPEKFRVMKEDGTFDIEASFGKVEEHRSNLEKRLGTGEHVRPKTAAEYVFTPPKEFEGKWEPGTDPKFTAFRDKAHEAGLSQAQFDLVMGQYLEVAPGLAEAGAVLNAEETIGKLRETWKGQGEFDKNLGASYRALTHYAGGGEQAKALEQRYGNDPEFIQLLARIGADMGEASAVANGDGVGDGSSAEDLMRSEAYLNPKHADHAAVAAKVQRHYQKKYGTAAAA